MKSLWIGIVEMKITADDTDLGYKTGFANFVTWADSEDEFKKNVLDCVEGYKWEMLSVEKARPIDPRSTYSEEIEEIIERAQDNLRACIFGTFHSYPVN